MKGYSNLDIRWRYTYKDGTSVVASSLEEANIKHDKLIKNSQSK